MGKQNLTTEHVNSSMNEITNQKMIATANEVKKEFGATDTLRYIKNETYIADSKVLLGKVFFEKNGSNELKPFIISVEAKVDENSILKTPMTKAELILDAKAMASVELFSIVNLGANAEELFEFRIIDNSAARLIDRGDEWLSALLKWMSNPLSKEIINNQEIGSIGVVTGVVQKYISTKKYRKFQADVKGGAFGINIGGSLYTSVSEFTLDIVYGLDIVYLPKVLSMRDFVSNVENNKTITDNAEINRLNGYFTKLALKTKDFVKI